LIADPVNSLVNKTGLRSRAMASVRTRARKNGTEYYAVLYRFNGKQTSTSFEDFASASKFCDLATKYGPENALRTLRVDTTLATLTVEQWVKWHIDVLTGVDQNTSDKYRAYLRNDIAEPLGALPLTALGREHIAQWVKGMQQTDDKGWTPSAKTIANKHGFLAGALSGWRMVESSARIVDHDCRRFAVQGIPVPGGDHQPRGVAVLPVPAQPA
jgi:hypothetical protein